MYLNILFENIIPFYFLNSFIYKFCGEATAKAAKSDVNFIHIKSASISSNVLALYLLMNITLKYSVTITQN